MRSPESSDLATPLSVARRVGVAIIAVALTAAAVWFLTAGRRWLVESPTFAIERFEISGNRRAKDATLLAAAGLSAGDNLFRVDLESAERAMADSPWVRYAAITRAPPKTLRIRILEQEPVALVEMTGLWYANADGVLFQRVAAGDSLDLPILSGFGVKGLSGLEELDKPLFREGMQIVAAYRDWGLEARERLSQVVYDPRDPEDGFTLLCGADAFEVKLGRDEIDAKMLELRDTLKAAEDLGMRNKVIRLDNRRQRGQVTVEPVVEAPPDEKGGGGGRW